MKNLIIPLLLLSLFLFGGMMFKFSAPRTCNEILPNDSIFILTGDKRRIPFAMKKVNQYPNTDIYIIGAGAPSPSELTKPATIETESKSTYQNARAIKNIVTEKKLNRVVIVTTEDHMPRAKYLIKQELPNTYIVTCPATLRGMPVAKRLERWTIEYVKYIVTMFGIKEG